uniref:Uncharacterized protein n=1 Tax=Cacopsylla melanoneura TaxID=428564 RepID=A0A8D8ZJQ2_9HEMI
MFQTSEIKEMRKEHGTHHGEYKREICTSISVCGIAGDGCYCYGLIPQMPNVTKMLLLLQSYIITQNGNKAEEFRLIFFSFFFSPHKKLVSAQINVCQSRFAIIIIFSLV